MDVYQSISPENRAAIDALTAQFMENAFASKAAMFVELNALARDGAIVFAGDSITEGFPIHEFFPPSLPLYNRGIGGITSRQLQEHLHALVLGMHPKKAFILVGTNDSHKGADLSTTSETIRAICTQIGEDSPNTAIFLLSILPVNNTKDAYQYAIAGRNNMDNKKLNELISANVDMLPNVTYVDLHSHLVDAQGNLAEEYTTDGLHISVKGYQKIVELLLPFVLD